MMKKTIITVILAVCMFLLPLSTYANTLVQNAFSVEDETREILSVAEDETVFRVYYGYFMYGFSLGQSLEETFNDGWSLMQTYYVTASTDEYGDTSLSSKTITDGVATEATEHEIVDRAFYELVDQNDRILSVLGNHVTSRKTIYMHGYYFDGMYIYYETNIGDYIYYRETPRAPDEYLIPLSEFYDIAKEVQAQRSGGAGGPGIGSVADEVSPYDISNYSAKPKFPLRNVVYCGVPILLAVSGYCWLIIRKRSLSKERSV